MEKDEFGYWIYKNQKSEIYIKASGAGKIEAKDASLVGEQVCGLTKIILKRTDSIHHVPITSPTGKIFYAMTSHDGKEVRVSWPSLKPNVSKKGRISWNYEKTDKIEKILNFNPLC
jgi:hypothetical protein